MFLHILTEIYLEISKSYEVTDRSILLHSTKAVGFKQAQG